MQKLLSLISSNYLIQYKSCLFLLLGLSFILFCPLTFKRSLHSRRRAIFIVNVAFNQFCSHMIKSLFHSFFGHQGTVVRCQLIPRGLCFLYFSFRRPILRYLQCQSSLLGVLIINFHCFHRVHHCCICHPLCIWHT